MRALLKASEQKHLTTVNLKLKSVDGSNLYEESEELIIYKCKQNEFELPGVFILDPVVTFVRLV